jgi:hypothetical protein
MLPEEFLLNSRCVFFLERINMSQRSVERTVGKLVTDQGFRMEFFRDPSGSALRLGVDLSPDEMDALLRIPAKALDTLYGKLDDRICRLHIIQEPVDQGERR